ncbi:MAG: hypothetical protein ABJB85_09945 [Nitrososphaerota archaeon]
MEDKYCYRLKRKILLLRILKDAGVITERRQAKIGISINKKTTELVRFFDSIHDYNLESLKEYVENKENKNGK